MYYNIILYLESAAEADELAALHGVPEEPGDQEPEESDGDGSSSESNFGVAEVKKKKGKDATTTGKNKGGSRKAEPVKQEAADKSEKAIERAAGVASALEPISPLMIWQGTAKEKDCATRASKALALAEGLSKDGRPEAKSMADKLKTASETMERNLETLSALRFDETTSAVEACRSFDPIFLERVASLPADCLNAVLCDWGRKILEDYICILYYYKLRFTVRFKF